MKKNFTAEEMNRLDELLDGSENISLMVEHGISLCEKAINEGKIYQSREGTDPEHGFIYLAMMINRLKDVLEIFQKLNLLTETAASSGNTMMQEEQSITEQLTAIERKVDLLVDTLGGEDNYYNGHYVCNDLFAIQNVAEAIENILKYGFPKAAKRAEENKREYDEAMNRLAKRFQERSIR